MASALRSLTDRDMRVMGNVTLRVRLGARPSRKNPLWRWSKVVLR